MVVERERIGEPFLLGAIRIHGIDFHVAVALGNESDSFAVGTDHGIELQRWVLSQPDRFAGLDISRINIPTSRRL
jgi:hypothetical protein